MLNQSASVLRTIFATLFALGLLSACDTLAAQQIKTTMTVDLLDRTAISSSVDGVIETVAARAGEQVTKGQLLVQISTQRRELELEVTRADYEALLKRSKNNTQELVNAAREQSARFNVSKLTEAASLYGLSVPALERVRAESELEQATTEKQGARKELAQFASEAEAKLNEAKLLEFDIQESRINSPFDGAFARVDRRPGEFVQQGETIAELYRLDRLTGVALIDRKQLLPEHAVGVEGRLLVASRDAKETYPITIKRVLPRVDVDGLYRAVVELQNAKNPSGRWRLLPGTVGQAVFMLAEKGLAGAGTAGKSSAGRVATKPIEP